MCLVYRFLYCWFSRHFYCGHMCDNVSCYDHYPLVYLLILCLVFLRLAFFVLTQKAQNVSYICVQSGYTKIFLSYIIVFCKKKTIRRRKKESIHALVLLLPTKEETRLSGTYMGVLSMLCLTWNDFPWSSIALN